MRALKIVGLASARSPTVALRLKVCGVADRLAINLNDSFVCAQDGKEYNNRLRTDGRSDTGALTSTGKKDVEVMREFSAIMNVDAGSSTPAAVHQRHESTFAWEADRVRTAPRAPLRRERASQRTGAERRNFRSQIAGRLGLTPDSRHLRRYASTGEISRMMAEQALTCYGPSAYPNSLSQSVAEGYARLQLESGRLSTHGGSVSPALLGTAERGAQQSGGTAAARAQARFEDLHTAEVPLSIPWRPRHGHRSPLTRPDESQEVTVRCSRHEVRVWRHKLGRS